MVVFVVCRCVVVLDCLLANKRYRDKLTDSEIHSSLRKRQRFVCIFTKNWNFTQKSGFPAKTVQNAKKGDSNFVLPTTPKNTIFADILLAQF